MLNESLRLGLAGALIFAATAAHASLPKADFLSSPSVPSAPSAPSSRQYGMQEGNWYDVTSPAEVKVLQVYGLDGVTPVRSSSVGSLVMDETFSFKPVRIDTQRNTAIIDVGDAEDEGDNLGQNFYEIALTDLAALRPRSVDVEALLDATPAGEIPNEWVDTEVASRHAVKPKKRRSAVGGWCARDVREVTGVANNGWCASAQYGSGYYRSHGYHSVGTAWEKAKVGTVCFFGGGHATEHCRRAGHMAVKVSSGMWKGSGTRPYPYPDRDWKAKGYTFQGCLAK